MLGKIFVVEYLIHLCGSIVLLQHTGKDICEVWKFVQKSFLDKYTIVIE